MPKTSLYILIEIDALKAVDNMDKYGTYEHCSNCCVDFEEIDAPVLSKKEVEKLKVINKRSDFYNKVNEEVYTLKTRDSRCIFFQNDKCSIYECRPMDCRLFPFDLKKKGDKYYLALYELDCIDVKKFRNNAKSVEPIIKELILWIVVQTV